MSVATTPIVAPPSRRRWVALIVLSAALALDVMGVAVVNTALPAIAADLGVGEAELPWVMTAYALVFAGFLLPADRPGRARGLDVPGAALISAGLVALVFGVGQAEHVGFGAPPAWVPLALGMLLLIGFGWREHAARSPLLPLSLLSGRPVQAATITGALFYFAVNGLLYFAPLYMQGTLGYTAMQSGLAIVPMGLTVIVSARVAGRLMPRTGPRPLLVGGMILIAVGVATWTTIGTGTTYLFGLLPGILTMSVGQGFAFTAMTAASLTGVDPDRHGVAGGLNITAQQVGTGIGVAVLAVIAASATGAGPEGVLQGYHAAIAVAAAAGVAAAVVIAAVLRRSSDR